MGMKNIHLFALKKYGETTLDSGYAKLTRIFLWPMEANSLMRETENFNKICLWLRKETLPNLNLKECVRKKESVRE